jgi:hypothetical protein
MMDILYVGELREDVESATKCVEDAFPGTFELEDEWDFIHEYRIAVKPKHPPRTIPSSSEHTSSTSSRAATARCRPSRP